MRFVCGKCQTKYAIPDERVHGKLLKVRCKTCGEIIEVREGPVAAAAPAVAAAPRPAPVAAPVVAPAPKPAPVAAPAIAPTAKPAPLAAPKPAPMGAPKPAPMTAPKPASPAPGSLFAKPSPSPGAAPKPAPAAPFAPKPAGASPAPSRPSPAVSPVPKPSAAPAPAPAPARQATLPAAPRGPLARPAAGPATATARALDAEPGAGLLETLHSVAAEQATTWFVAIQDVPVGPIGREELRRKIQQGAVSGSSLTWCEGMPDWRPLREIAALADLLRVSASPAPAVVPPAPPPPPAKKDGASDLLAALKSGRGPAPSVRTGKTEVPAQFPDPDATPMPTPAQAAMIAAAPAPAAAPEVRPTADSIVMPLPERRSRFGPLTMITLGFAVVFAVTLALGLLGVIGPRHESETPPETTRPREPDEIAQADPTPNEGLRGLAGSPETAAPAADAGVLEVTSSGSTHRHSRDGASKEPNAADAELLRRMQALAADGTGEAPVSVGSSRTKTGGSGPAAQGLSETQIRNVVNRERPGIQRCYEREMRGTKNTNDVRIMLTVNIGPSGSVTNVGLSGAARRGTPLGDCIYNSVRRWRFPSAGAPSVLESPFLLTAAH